MANERDRRDGEDELPDPTEDRGFHDAGPFTSVVLQVVSQRQPTSAADNLIVVGDKTLESAGRIMGGTELLRLAELSVIELKIISVLSDRGAWDTDRKTEINPDILFRAVGCEPPCDQPTGMLPYICVDVLSRLGIREKIRMAALKAMSKPQSATPVGPEDIGADIDGFDPSA